MRRRAAAILAAAAAGSLAAAAPAGAQGIAGPLPFGDALSSVTFLSVSASGSVAVEWEGDPATCEAARRCAQRGTTTWRLPEDGLLLLFERGRRREGALFLSGRDFARSAPVTSRVRTGPRLCADAAASEGFLRLRAAGGLLALGLGGQGVLGATRCGGPVDADLAAALPVVRVPFRRIARGRLTVRLGGTGTFAAGGLRGRVTSTMRLRVHAPQDDVTQRIGRSPVRVRTAVAGFRVASIAGDVPVELTGGGSAGCAALDACGMTGVQRVVPAVSAGSIDVIAYGRARLTRRELRAALGLAPGGVPRRVSAFGHGELAGEGRIETTVGRPGEPGCTDTAPFPRGSLTLEPHGTRVTATFDSGSAGPPRTRCPGPLLVRPGGLVSAELPLRALGRRRVVLRFTRPQSFLDEGWSARARPALTVVLERTRLVERVIRLG